MFSQNRKSIYLLAGDLLIFYLSLYLAILMRHGLPFHREIWEQCFLPFSVIFAVWILLFSVSHLYELRYAANRKNFFEMVFKLYSLAAVIAVVYFYFFSSSFAPKKVLFLTIIGSLVLFLVWRIFFNRVVKMPRAKVLIVSAAKEARELEMFLEKHPQMGYIIAKIMPPSALGRIQEELKQEKIDLLVIDADLFDGLVSHFSHRHWQLSVIDIEEFYESVLQRTPVEILSPLWFLKNYYSRNWQFYETLKRICDLAGGIILFVVSLPLWPLIALGIILDSPGPVLYQSVRVGWRDQKFRIYKFRTMFDQKGKTGLAWTLKDDPRITRFGKILRFLHLDEVPQVLNIIKGDLSFVGPRPEEEKLVDLFRQKIPFYHFRLLVKPGVIGWAQINYPHSSSVEDAQEKLSYDFYYLKNRNILFDFIIACKAWRIPFEIPTH